MTLVVEFQGAEVIYCSFQRICHLVTFRGVVVAAARAAGIGKTAISVHFFGKWIKVSKSQMHISLFSFMPTKKDKNIF